MIVAMDEESCTSEAVMYPWCNRRTVFGCADPWCSSWSMREWFPTKRFVAMRALMRPFLFMHSAVRMCYDIVDYVGESMSFFYPLIFFFLHIRGTALDILTVYEKERLHECRLQEASPWSRCSYHYSIHTILSTYVHSRSAEYRSN